MRAPHPAFIAKNHLPAEEPQKAYLLRGDVLPGFRCGVRDLFAM